MLLAGLAISPLEHHCSTRRVSGVLEGIGLGLWSFRIEFCGLRFTVWGFQA